jgi:nucleoid-associated protein YgaU
MDAGEMKARIAAEQLAKSRAAAERMSKPGSSSASAAKEKEAELKKAKAEMMAKLNNAQTGVKTATAMGARAGTPLGAASMYGVRVGPAAAQGQKAAVEYTVKKGDTLSQIAKNHYGFATQPYWKLIQDANKDLIKDANLIYPGQVFKIPELPEAMKKK